ncbi:TM2 domain-containing protein [Nesterenkonia alba]|uniref:TM2 domain-containing protein n=1 Tax=Nesterenkonia alba TaxID=515814 RepID=UPI0003B46F8B|nr:TM2 domain-containing protein [Nesterenkonia alba]
MTYYPDPHQPAPYHPGPPKSHAAAIILSLFLGTLGIDRFYLGHVGVGLAKLFLSWMTFGIWQLIDLILIICKGTNGLKRINWQ